MNRIFYTLLLYLLLPFTPLRLWWRGRKQPQYRQHWAERFGFYTNAVNRPMIWLHCVSVGETRAAEPLIKQLLREYPQYQILLTHTTPTGRETSTMLFGEQVQRVYLPYDTPGGVARFLRHFKPSIGILMETELWFNLIAACTRAEIPLFLVNARLSEKSARRYAKIPQLISPALKCLTAIAAQTQADAARFVALGANNVQIAGNLKFDVHVPPDTTEKAQQLKIALGNRPVFLAASTRDGEETLILDALQQVHIPQLLTIIVPRHPQRFADVGKLVQQRGLSYVWRSDLNTQANAPQQVPANCNVVIGNSMGEMFTYYAVADIALIGGSLLPFGGQNLIEACAVKTPVIVGSHTYNFAWAADEAIKRGAARRIATPTELAHTIQTLFDNAPQRQRMAAAGAQFSQDMQGATQRIGTMLASYLRTAAFDK